ncbi:MAG: response regulator [Planctomycetia bacterium]|nr:response regulator [Planctomycetia bacterium]
MRNPVAISCCQCCQRYSPQAIQSRAAPPPCAGDRGHETLLLVEDEDVVRRLAGHIVRRAGCTVREANQGAAALEVSEQHRGHLHLLVTDLVMPGMNGKELAGRLRQQRPGLPVLYVSGYAAETEFRPGELEANSSFMQKPFVPALLLSRVRQLLDQAHDGNSTQSDEADCSACAHAASVP